MCCRAPRGARGLKRWLFHLRNGRAPRGARGLKRWRAEN